MNLSPDTNRSENIGREPDAAEKNAVHARRSGLTAAKPRESRQRDGGGSLPFGSLLQPTKHNPDIGFLRGLERPSLRPMPPVPGEASERESGTRSGRTGFEQSVVQPMTMPMQVVVPRMDVPAMAAAFVSRADAAARISHLVERGGFERDVDGSLAFQVDLSSELLGGANVKVRRVGEGEIELIVRSRDGATVDPEEVAGLTRELERRGLRTRVRVC